MSEGGLLSETQTKHKHGVSDWGNGWIMSPKGVPMCVRTCYSDERLYPIEWSDDQTIDAVTFVPGFILIKSEGEITAVATEGMIEVNISAGDPAD